MLSVLFHIVLICVELKLITHARIEVITHVCTMLRAFYCFRCCHEGKNCGRLVVAVFVTVVLAF